MNISFDLLKAKSWLFLDIPLSTRENALLREANEIKIIKKCMTLSIKRYIIKIIHLYTFKDIFFFRNKKAKQGTPVFAEVELEKDLLKNSGLSYKYCFRRKGNQSQEPEFIFQNFLPYRNQYRVLKVPVCLGNSFLFL